MPTLALDIGGTHTRLALYTPSQRLYARRSHSHATTHPVSLTEVSGLISNYLSEQGLAPENIVGIGVSVAGLVDKAAGVVLRAENLGWSGMPLGAQLEHTFSSRVHIDTDVFCGALAEARLGAAQGTVAALFLAIGTGIGHAFILQGEVWRGVTGAANAFGHLIVEPGGARCYCGLRGCVCQYASGSALPGGMVLSAHHHGEPLASIPPGHAVVAQADRGEPIAQHALHRATDALARALGSALTLINPQRIIFTGGAVSTRWPDLNTLQAALEPYTYPGTGPAELVRSPLSNDANLLGAALLAQDATPP